MNRTVPFRSNQLNALPTTAATSEPPSHSFTSLEHDCTRHRSLFIGNKVRSISSGPTNHIGTASRRATGFGGPLSKSIFKVIDGI